MSLTVLFDLDDTLLHTNMDKFLPQYFKGLGETLSHLAPPARLTDQIYTAVNKMTINQDPGELLSEIFSRNFYPPLGTTEEACAPEIKYFYREEYPKLRLLTLPKPEASDLVEWCLAQDFSVAVATNPLFPETATRQRILWAGLNPEDFSFFTHFNNFHFTKPNLTYYAEVLGRLGWPDTPAVMIGDNLTYDLLPMQNMGFDTYWVDPPIDETDQVHGPLIGVKPWLETINQNTDDQLNNHYDVHDAVLRSTPAVIDSWLRETSESKLHQKPSEEDWSMIEVVWHLLEMEKQIYLPQWKNILSDPLSPVAVKQFTVQPIESYSHQEFRDIFRQFLQNRQQSLDCVKELWENGLYKVTVQHAIFSQVTIGELVSFTTKHDRLHLRQLYNLLDNY